MERLPVELVEILATFLDITDVCNLRLVSRDLRAKATQRHFMSHVAQQKDVYITPEGLKTFVAVTEPGAIGCGVEHVVLWAVLDIDNRLGTVDGLPSPSATREQLRLLSKAFAQLRSATWATGGLATLELKVCVWVNGRTLEPEQALSHTNRHGQKEVQKDAGVILGQVRWDSVWAICSRTFQTTLAALSASQLQVARLKLFSAQSQCSLPLDRLHNGSGQVLPWPTFEHITKLSLSISHNFNLGAGYQTDIARADATTTMKPLLKPKTREAGDRNVMRLVRFLTAFPNLEALDVKWFSLEGEPWAPSHVTEQNFLVTLSDYLTFPKLSAISLRGLRTSSAALTRFLKKCEPLESIELEAIFFKNDDDLMPVLEYLDMSSNKHCRVHLSNIISDGMFYLFGTDEAYAYFGVGPPDPQSIVLDDDIPLLERMRRVYGPR